MRKLNVTDGQTDAQTDGRGALLYLPFILNVMIKKIVPTKYMMGFLISLCGGGALTYMSATGKCLGWEDSGTGVP